MLKTDNFFNMINKADSTNEFMFAEKDRNGFSATCQMLFNLDFDSSPITVVDDYTPNKVTILLEFNDNSSITISCGEKLVTMTHKAFDGESLGVTRVDRNYAKQSVIDMLMMHHPNPYK